MIEQLENLICDTECAIEDLLYSGVNYKHSPYLAELICSAKVLKEYKCGLKEHKPEDWILHRAESEIAAVKEYYNKWIETNDETYKQIARDEAKHAEHFIIKAEEQGKNVYKFRQELNPLLEHLK